MGFGEKTSPDRIGWHGTYVADDTYDVFVSYSRADGRHAAEIDSVLRDGLTPTSREFANMFSTVMPVELADRLSLGVAGFSRPFG